MRERTAGFIESLLLLLVRALLPARGRHRAALAQPAVSNQPLAPDPRRSYRAADPFEYDTPLVRPYLLTPTERHERKLQRQLRRALWLAAHGIDVGPCRIHGVEVSA
ncbi:hypothetical protein [Streptomyces aurantiogriseus]|uniref:Uncharacterized protein n=1 Tax=Streptomyces aurantiogriseus TaxID=66870 RepID=A0A918KY22_9ACTN|nr:hypothetical protein [Streptomyces aurantiogriseus]GGR44416.1 hypothetical protein GCM10010251_71630 [Streptomyces aurantiogriseus]